LSIAAFPLQWPSGFPRWQKARGSSAFRTDFETSIRNVRKSLEAFGKDSGKPIREPVLSSNVDLNPLTEQLTHSGMSLRDYFAAQALSPCVAMVISVETSGGVLKKDAAICAAEMAYQIADAMLAAKDSPHGQ
jgi:hypothetical protein